MIRSIYKAIVGLEVHAQIRTESKLFSHGGANYVSSPNTQLDLFDIALPGTLPTLNRACVEAAVKTALALNCTVKSESHFDRKHYFYSDLPAGYQITQYNRPIADNGYLEFVALPWWTPIIQSGPFDLIEYMLNGHVSGQAEPPQAYVRRSKIKQIQLEQDSAKSFHESVDDSAGFSLVDYNRSGVALMELVFEPDLVDHHEATCLIKELIQVLKTIDTCECKLDQGTLRVDANVSIDSIDNKKVPSQLAGRIELKNLNSLRALSRGIEYEIKRQVDAIKNGDVVERQTRTFDSKSGRTIVLRKKEEASDYRYIPEPSLPILKFSQKQTDNGAFCIQSYESALPELPSVTRDRLQKRYALQMYLIPDIMRIDGLKQYLASTVESCQSCKDSNLIAKFLIHLPNQLAEQDKFSHLSYARNLFGGIISPELMANIIDLVEKKKLTFANAATLISHYLENGIEAKSSDPAQLVRILALEAINDNVEIERQCRDIALGMKSISKKYVKTRGKTQMRDMIEKLYEKNNGRIPVDTAHNICQPTELQINLFPLGPE
ncbi:Glutamyl-tRNA(Gln) amidotransferase subunit B, mitochondrial, partial [Fragariocoptes setiger]